jgi:hypothetical protein
MKISFYGLVIGINVIAAALLLTMNTHAVASSKAHNSALVNQQDSIELTGP